MQIVIVGGGTAGLSAAVWARRTHRQASIVVLDAAPIVSVGVCGLPHLLSGEIADPAALVLHSHAELESRYGITVLCQHPVTAVGRREVLANGRSFPFDRLIYCAGARGGPPLAGEFRSHVFRPRSLEDFLRLRAWLAGSGARGAAVVGGGYLGLELAEACLRRGLRTRLWEAGPACLGLSDWLHEPLLAEMQRRGLELERNAPVSGCPEGGLECRGERILADVVLLATGVQPNLPEGLDLRRGPSGAIRVDAYGETSQAGVYAAGDCVELPMRNGRGAHYRPLAGPAAALGRVAGINAAGGRERYRGGLGSFCMRFFDMEIATCGASEGQTLRRELQLRPVYLRQPPLRLELTLDERSGVILGGRAVGPEAKARIDQVALAVAGELRLEDLSDLDLTYAPSLGSLHDWNQVLWRELPGRPKS